MPQIIQWSINLMRKLLCEKNDSMRLSNHGRRARRSNEDQWQVYSFFEEHSSGVAFGWPIKN